MHWRRKWQPTPVFLPGEYQGQGSLAGCHLWVAQSRTRHAQTLCLCWQGPRGSAWPGVLGDLRGVGSEQSQARKHFKHLDFQEIMLQLDPQGYPLPPKPVAKPRLPELRVGRALTINLPLTPQGCPCSLSGWPGPGLGVVTTSHQGFCPASIAQQPWPWASHQGT